MITLWQLVGITIILSPVFAVLVVRYFQEGRRRGLAAAHDVYRRWEREELKSYPNLTPIRSRGLRLARAEYLRVLWWWPVIFKVRGWRTKPEKLLPPEVRIAELEDELWD